LDTIVLDPVWIARLLKAERAPVWKQETATTCRERCGGQGYLSVNKFGAILGFAHAGMTAEGDNRVLMQKVAKEYLATLNQPHVRERLQAGRSPVDLSGDVPPHAPLSFHFFPCPGCSTNL
jgi:hypothetical protein